MGEGVVGGDSGGGSGGGGGGGGAVVVVGGDVWGGGNGGGWGWKMLQKELHDRAKLFIQSPPPRWNGRTLYNFEGEPITLSLLILPRLCSHVK